MKIAAFVLALTFATLPTLGSAQDQQLGKVRPSYRYEKTLINVAAFNVTGTSLEPETLSRIIRNDLTLSGFFSMPPDQRWANTLNVSDARSGNINWAEWEKMGAKHYLMGRVTESGANTSVEVLLYDVDSKSLVINRRVVTAPTAQIRMLAHQISDIVVKFTQGVDGVARTRLTFVSELIPKNREVSVMDWDGFDPRQMTKTGNLVATPSWGLNGTEIYYTSYVGNRARVFGTQLKQDASLNFSPSSQWIIADYGGSNHTPSWSATAKRVALVLSRDGNSEIYSALRDGSDLRRLTETAFTEGSATWSPDGSKIAFVSNDSGAPHVFVMNADGTGRRRLTTRGGWNDEPNWSPDGRRIAFVSRNSGTNDIYVCEVSGEASSYKRLTMGQGNNEQPSWAPNNTHLAFTSDRTGRSQIYIMLDDGSAQTVITAKGTNRSPDWGPIPPTR